MADQTPSTSQGWEFRQLRQGLGFDSLTWNPNRQVRSLGPTEVLVKFHAAALNYSDIAITKGTYPLDVADGICPGADGSGKVLQIGERVTRFKPGDDVVAFLFQTGVFSNVPIGPEALQSTLGSGVDGTMRTHGVLDQEGLCHMPSTLSYEQGAAMGAAYLTAWNVLMGGPHQVRPGDSVLVQGSGGVSVAVLQLATLAGAVVVATTSSTERAGRLKELGAAHVINYKQNVTGWGKAAQVLSPGGRGFTFVVDVVGTPDSFSQSLEAVAPGGEIDVVGVLGTAKVNEGHAGPSFLDTLAKNCMVRGIKPGSRHQFEELLCAAGVRGLKPILDSRTFLLSDLKEAYKYLEDQLHFGKVVIKIA